MAKSTHRRPAALLYALLAMFLTCMYPMHVAAAANPVAPVATRRSAAAAGDTYALHASPTRILLHGNRPPENWTRCPRCTPVTCTSSRCSGHCRRPRMIVENCNAPRAALSAVVNAVLLPFAEAPYIGCSNLNSGVSGCELVPPMIAPRAGYTLDAPNGTVSARCFPDPVSPRSRTYGACLCAYTATDGISQMSAFCEASAGLAAELPVFDEYIETVYDNTGLILDYREEEVEYGGETVAVTLVTALEYVE